MDRDDISIEDIARFKAEARAIAAAEGMKHTKALDRIAQREGFRYWPELLALVGTTTEVRHSIRTLGLHIPRNLSTTESTA